MQCIHFHRIREINSIKAADSNTLAPHKQRQKQLGNCTRIAQAKANFKKNENKLNLLEHVRLERKEKKIT